jgi:tRNA-binding EMAP/Myf-like protein
VAAFISAPAVHHAPRTIGAAARLGSSGSGGAIRIAGQVYYRQLLSVRSMCSPTVDEEAVDSKPVGELTELARLEMRVGMVKSVSRHPEADGLYVEQIDLGEPEGPRTIVSGLVNFIAEDALNGSKVLVLANLKVRGILYSGRPLSAAHTSLLASPQPVNMRGVESAGMVLCSSNEDHSQVALLCPPEGAAVGELVSFEGHAPTPVEAGNRAGKAWKKASKNLVVGPDGIARFTGETLPADFMTSAGPVTSSLPGSIS